MKNVELYKLTRIKAKKYGLTKQQLEDIMDSSFRFLRFVLKEKTDRENLDFPSVRIPYFGIFYCPEWLKNKLRKIK